MKLSHRRCILHLHLPTHHQPSPPPTTPICDQLLHQSPHWPLQSKTTTTSLLLPWLPPSPLSYYDLSAFVSTLPGTAGSFPPWASLQEHSSVLVLLWLLHPSSAQHWDPAGSLASGFICPPAWTPVQGLCLIPTRNEYDSLGWTVEKTAQLDRRSNWSQGGWFCSKALLQAWPLVMGFLCWSIQGETCWVEF